MQEPVAGRKSFPPGQFCGRMRRDDPIRPPRNGSPDRKRTGE